MPREPALLSWVHRSARRKRPPAKLCASIVRKSLLELGPRVHHEWTVLCDWLVDRTTLEEKNLNRPIHSLEWHGLFSTDGNCRGCGDDAITNLQCSPGEDVKRPSDTGPNDRGHHPGGAGLEGNRPDRHLRFGIRRPGMWRWR